jgi:hypothetical protein
MSYDPTDWIEGVTKLGPTNLNHLEQGVADSLQVGDLDTDGTLAADSDAKVASQKATKTYVDTSVATGVATKQPLDSDLTAFAALDSSVAGTVATDGAGWVKKTYAQMKSKLGLALNAADYGVKFDAVMPVIYTAGMPDGAITSGQATFTTTGGLLTAAMVGKTAVISGAGASGGNLVTTVQSYTNANSVTLAASASTTVTAAMWIIGTDDTAAWQLAINAAVAKNGGQLVGIPPTAGAYGTSLINGSVTVPWGTFWKLYAPGLTLVQAADRTAHFIVTNSPQAGVTFERQSVGWQIEGPTWFTWVNKQATTVTTLGCLSGTGTGTFVVASSAAFPPGSTTLLIDKENVTGSFTGNTFTVTARGASLTTAVAHSGTPTVYPNALTNACVFYIADGTTVGGVDKNNYANFTIEKVGFDNGSYLVGCSTTDTGVWGWTLRDIYAAQSVVGGVISNICTIEGQPNNKIENVYALANSMIGPIFDLEASQSTWLTGIEINNSYQSPIIIRSRGRGTIALGSLKTELGTYDSRGAQCALFDISNEGFEAQYIRVQGMNIDVTGVTNPAMFRRQTGSTGVNIHIGTIDFVGDYLSSTADPAGTLINGIKITGGNHFLTDSIPTQGLFVVDQIYCTPVRNFYLQENISGGSDAPYIADSCRGRVSGDKANNDYTWHPLGVGASSTLSLATGTNPADGDKVTIGAANGLSVAYTFKNTLGAANDVKIGADWDATLTSLAHAINGDGVIGTDYYTGTRLLPTTLATTTLLGSTSSTLTCTATWGTAGNTFVSTYTKFGATTFLAWTGSTFSGGLLAENVICYETALTANRTVTLPASATATVSWNFNGAKVRILRTGGGNFDLIIMRGGVEMNRIFAGQTGSIEYTYKRGFWVVTGDSRTTAATTSNPGDPSGTTNTTGKMMGLAGSISPVKTGRVLVSFTGDIFNPTAIADGAKTQVRFGTGSAPANGDANTGTTVGNIVKYVTSTTDERVPFCNTVLITGLTLGTTYWVDLSLAAITAGTATIENLTYTAVEV